MPLLLGQLVYTSFSEVGFGVLTSTQVPKQIQQAFIQQVVHQYWDAYNPPKPGYRAAYLHQVTPEHNLFGWLYNDGLDDLGRDHVPYFICYYLAEQLQAVHLEDIFAWLHWGPLALIDRHNPPVDLGTIVVPDASNYRPVSVGVAIPSGVRERSQFALKQKKLLDIFVPLNELGTVTERNEQSGKQQEADDKSVPPAGKRSQITRTALLVGVSDYGSGLSSLPGVLNNVTALQQVLQQPEIGRFTEVKTLLNPDPQTMAEALETLFAERQKDDLVLLYFAGRGLQDDYGKLYLTSSRSRENQQKKLVKSSAIPATFVQEVMNESQAQHQLLILDCCWSSTLSADDSWWVDINGQLQGAGRVILTATTSTSCYFQDNASGLSVYTRYLVEGLATGAADLNQDGAILVAELHDYSQRKVQVVTPLMQPQMYGTDEQLVVAQAAIDDPLFQYRHAAEGYTERGKFSLVGRSVLDVLRESLEIGDVAAAAIEAQVLQPGREYQIKLQRYVQELVAMCASGGWSEVVLRRCRSQQRLLGLREEDVAALTEQIAGQLNVLQAQPSVSSSEVIGTSVPTVIFPPRTSANGNADNTTHPYPVLSHKNFWLLVGVGIGMSLTAVVGVMSAYIQLNEIRNLQIEAKYEECSAKAEIKSWAAETFLYKNVQGLLNECRFQQAKMLAADNKFSAAIRTAKKIPKNNPLHPQAQQLIKEWSEI